MLAAPLDEVANQEKMMPRTLISDHGLGITAEARRYFAPLVMGEAYPEYKDGLPFYVKLIRHLIYKKLPPNNHWWS